MDKAKNEAIKVAGATRKLAITTLDLWLRTYPLSTVNLWGIENIWKAFDKIKMDLLNLRLEAERDKEE